MGLKEKTFIIFLIIIICFPFFFSKKKIAVEKKINLPNIIIKKGYFKSYNIVLEKQGHFNKLNYFNQNDYNTNNLKIHFLDKNSTLYAKKMNYNGLYNFINATYINKDYTYKAKTANYNDRKKILIAYNFNFFNRKIDGKGKKMIYKNDILTADNIFYTIKGLK